MDYYIDSKSYLKRARKCLDDGTPESLFYAAFELRCGIESRLQQYLDAHKQIIKQKKMDWEIPKLVKNLEKVFANLEKIACVTMKDVETEKIIYMCYFTPVTKHLREAAGRIGNLMHCPQEYRKFDDPWWVETRQFLEETYGELMIASQGDLLGVPLLNRSNNTASIHLEIDGEIADKNLSSSVGKRLEISMTFVDKLPPAP